MSNNKDVKDFINKKREKAIDTEDPFRQESTKKIEKNESSLFPIPNNDSLFPNPNQINSYLIKKDTNLNPGYYQTAMTPTYDTTHLFQQTSHSNFFNPSNAITTPLSPAYTPQHNNVSYYNYNKSNANFPDKSPRVSATNKTTSGNDVDYSSTDNFATPSHPIENINMPDINAPKLQNIVATVNLKCALELRDIALKAKNAEYNPKRFAAVIMRIREPKTTALIFASGKMVVTGARSEEDSRKASRQFAKIIMKLGYQVKFTEFKIQNIVGSCDVRFAIRLEGLAATHSKFCSYEPEMFPGLIYKMAQPKIVLLIFVSGKIVLTGAKDRSDIFTAYEKIYPVLLGFRKKENSITQPPSDSLDTKKSNTGSMYANTKTATSHFSGN